MQEINGKLNAAKLGLIKVNEERAKLDRNYSDILAEEFKLRGEFRILQRIEADEITKKKEEKKDKEK